MTNHNETSNVAPAQEISTAAESSKEPLSTDNSFSHSEITQRLIRYRKQLEKVNTHDDPTIKAINKFLEHSSKKIENLKFRDKRKQSLIHQAIQDARSAQFMKENQISFSAGLEQEKKIGFATSSLMCATLLAMTVVNFAFPLLGDYMHWTFLGLLPFEAAGGIKTIDNLRENHANGHLTKTDKIKTGLVIGGTTLAVCSAIVLGGMFALAPVGMGLGLVVGGIFAAVMLTRLYHLSKELHHLQAQGKALTSASSVCKSEELQNAQMLNQKRTQISVGKVVAMATLSACVLTAFVVPHLFVLGAAAVLTIKIGIALASAAAALLSGTMGVSLFSSPEKQATEEMTKPNSASTTPVQNMLSQDSNRQDDSLTAAA